MGEGQERGLGGVRPQTEKGGAAVVLCSIDGHSRGYGGAHDTMLTANASSAHGMVVLSGRAPDTLHRLHWDVPAEGIWMLGSVSHRPSEALPFAATVASPAVSL